MPAAQPISRRLALAALGLTACSGRYGTGAGPSRRLVVRGSDTLAPLMQRWADAYRQVAPDVVLELSGGGSGTGIAALSNGTADVAMASRRVTGNERAKLEAGGQPLKEHAVALDAIAVYVHRENDIRSFALEELALIYRGRVRRWREVGGADVPFVLYSRENSSGTYAYFKEHVLAQLDFAAETQCLPGTSAVVSATRADAKAIGYGGIARASGVRVVPLRDAAGDLVTPTLETTRSGRYPLARPLYVYTHAEDAAVSDFIRFLAGAKAQGLVEGSGFFPTLEDGA